ncbi:MAG: hemerythrin domain-containing protein, partial [Gammaproteobacteria bacterium]|nr:hemerythrin domain-containing protein [Gammaproteobacteria bacterium]
MSDALLLLRLEHENLGQLLDLIDEQRQLRETGGDLDLGLLETVTEYFSGYPEQCHHPVEELVFRRLKMRDPDAVTDSDKLTDEHAQIERLTAELAEAVTSDSDTTTLAEIMKRFVTDYRRHMSMEEEHFFPAA